MGQPCDASRGGPGEPTETRRAISSQGTTSWQRHRARVQSRQEPLPQRRGKGPVGRPRSLEGARHLARHSLAPCECSTTTYPLLEATPDPVSDHAQGGEGLEQGCRQQDEGKGPRPPEMVSRPFAVRWYCAHGAVRYCQVCEKQCRDENGFKCHTASEGASRSLCT